MFDQVKTYEYPGFGDIAVGGLKVLLFLAFLAAGWALLNKWTDFDDHYELFERDNVAFAIVRSGFVLGHAVAMLALLAYASDPWWVSVLWQIGLSIWVLGLFMGLQPWVERLVKRARTISREDRMREAVLAIAVVQAATHVTIGLIIGATLSGTAPSVATGLLATLVFTVLGLGFLVATYWLLGELIRVRVPVNAEGQRMLEREDGYRDYRKWSLNDLVRDGNLSAAFISAGFMLGLGFILRNAIAGDFKGWVPAIVAFLVAAVLAVIALYVALWLLDKFVVTSATLRQIICSDRQVPAAVMGMLLVAAALGVTSVVL